MIENKNKNQQLHDSNNPNNIVGFSRTELFSGPVPTPEIIERYEKIYPGAAKLIFDKWDSQVKHRHHIEKVLYGQTIQNQFWE